jgi:ADP-heptose:LPS heptosyltransferase
LLKEKRLFSAAFSGFNRSFNGAAEVCCLLTRSEDLPLLYLAGRTGAPVRAGYAGAGIFPFINFHVKPSPEREYLTERNCAMAETLGAGKMKKAGWSVARQPRVEIDHFLKDNRLPRSAGIDAFFFHRVFGAEQAKGIIKAMVPFANNAFYLYADKTPDASEMQWFSQFDLPLIHNITIAQVAALISSSKLVVSGNTLLFGFAVLLGKKAVGVFKKDEIGAYCPKTSAAVRGIVYDKTSVAETVSGIIRAVAELTSIP